MVITFYGTSAELIKMYGIIKGLPRDQQLLICTAQQHAGLQKVHKQLDIFPDIYLAKGWKGRDVANMGQMLGLMLFAHGTFLKKYRGLKKMIRDNEKQFGTKSVVIVHGDTLTTVVGSYLGRSLRLPVAHVEAGLRSGSWKNPFPEEIDRRVAAKIARIHFPPSKHAEQNLRDEGVKGAIQNTVYNTAKDAISVADNFVSENYKKLQLPEHYGLVLLHRTELLESKEQFEAILRALREHADAGNKLVFTEHTTTGERLRSYGFEKYLTHENIIRIPKQPYFDFMAIVKGSDYAVTDGGGLQEDCFFLGIPVVIHRERTERQDGLGVNATLSRMDVSAVKDFLKNHSSKESFAKLQDTQSPSQVVIDYLQKHLYIT